MILLLDNKDSFVWNLAQALQVLGAGVTVVRSDRLQVEDAGAAAAIVLSPGPGRPEDAGASVAVVRRWSGQRPILGVCLGHQAIAAAFGARVLRGPPCHGRASAVEHAGTGLYRGLPAPAPFCRYHSLCVVPDSLPPELVADAFTPEGVLMGLHHREHRTFGVQFHPESFCSPHGPALLANFLREVA